MIKHFDVWSPGQTVQTCFIKHRQTSERKELWATNLRRVPQRFQRYGICDNASRMHEPNMIDTPTQTSQTSSNKHENKINLWWSLIECVMEFKLDQTPSNIFKQGGQTVKCLITNNVWRCLVVKHFLLVQSIIKLLINKLDYAYFVFVHFSFFLGS